MTARKKCLCSQMMRCHIVRGMHRALAKGYLDVSMSRAFNSTKTFLEGSELKFAVLENRALFRLTGPDTLGFLQGLITNDTGYLDASGTRSQLCLYALMLNSQGRVVHDLILYNCTDEKSRALDIMLECDKSNSEDLANTLLKYRMRKKIDILRVSETLSVIAAFPGAVTPQLLEPNIQNLRLAPACLPEIRWHSHATAWCLDPRLSRLGCRLILPKGEDPTSYFMDARKVTEQEYEATRYAFGVPEGVKDILPGKSLPLESNGDYLNGISFHKGCYIGQELTARTHHTGVVRKRLMPLKFSSFQRHKVERAKADAKITSEETGEVVGRLRGVSGLYGLGLLRTDKVQKSSILKVEIEEEEQAFVETHFPFWWGNPDMAGEIRGFQTEDKSVVGEPA